VPNAAGPTFLRDFDHERTRDGLIIVSSTSSREEEKNYAAQMSAAAATHYSIDAEALVRLVNECCGDGEWTDRVAYLTSGNLGKQRGMPGEMLLQQQVFPPVSSLFLCFGSDHDLFKWEQYVRSGFNCRWTRGDNNNTVTEIKDDNEFSCKPDPTLGATGRGLVLWTMELKADLVSMAQIDVFKCVVLTSITAVALVTRGAAAQVAVPYGKCWSGCRSVCYHHEVRHGSSAG
jgi:hypothetical protein